MNKEQAKQMIRDANAKADPWADSFCDWMKASKCTTCWLVFIAGAGPVTYFVVRILRAVFSS